MHSQRKSDHIRINLAEDVNYKRVTTGFERYRFMHCALPGFNLRDVNTSVEFLGKALQSPILISSMTGGTQEAGLINTRLAEAAQAAGVGMGLGSLRAAIDDASLLDTYKVRSVAPDILLLANLGAVQLNLGYGTDECRRAVEAVEADALILHLNPLHEALQPDGDDHFAGLLTKIDAVCRALNVPVVIKEVGFGISEQVARLLAGAGVAAIDVAGAGGSSWSQVEVYRATSPVYRRVAETFADWGIPTAESLAMTRRGSPDLPILASGGIRDGIQVAKALALGAAACGIAGPLLRAATDSSEAVAQYLATVVAELRLAMFSVGAVDIPALSRTPLQLSGERAPVRD